MCLHKTFADLLSTIYYAPLLSYTYCNCTKTQHHALHLHVPKDDHSFLHNVKHGKSLDRPPWSFFLVLELFWLCGLWMCKMLSFTRVGGCPSYPPHLAWIIKQTVSSFSSPLLRLLLLFLLLLLVVTKKHWDQIFPLISIEAIMLHFMVIWCTDESQWLIMLCITFLFGALQISYDCTGSLCYPILHSTIGYHNATEEGKEKSSTGEGIYSTKPSSHWFRWTWWRKWNMWVLFVTDQFCLIDQQKELNLRVNLFPGNILSLLPLQSLRQIP